MKDEKETKYRLLESAKLEFIEKGYNNASLRNICKNAGVTTGALYFFFKDKDELFAAIVGEPVKQVLQIAKEHYQSEEDEMEGGEIKIDFSQDFEHSIKAIRCMYQYRDEIRLVLLQAQGSRYEHIVDDIVDITEEHYRVLMDRLTDSMEKKRFDDYFIHWMSHIQVDMYVHLITHVDSEKEALSYMKDTMDYLILGWTGLLQQRE